MDFIYFDTETTGLSPEKDEIIEIAAVSTARQKEFCSFCKPTVPISPESTSITGITEKMVEDAPGFAQVARDFASFCDVEGACLIAHNNLGFDLPFLRAQFQKFDVLLPSSWCFLDTLYWARHYRPDLPRHSLQYLRKIYGFEENQAHRALDDVIMLKNIFESMIDDLPSSFVKEKLLMLQGAK